jgi:medium-chain acyl-[acyl-carrier-protein] hydrolase
LATRKGVLSAWLGNRKLRSNSALRLFCLPYAGDLGTGFYRWQSLLEPRIEVCPVILPGRGVRNDEPLIRRSKEMVEALSSSLHEYLDQPFAIFGHSLGALLAYEWACALARSNAPQPRMLFVSGRPAPHLPWRHKHVHSMDRQEFVRTLSEFEGTPQDILADPMVMALLAPIIQADFEISETYTPGERMRLSCPITALSGRSDRFASELEMAAWAEHTTGPFTLRVLEGSHFFIRSEETDVIDTVTKCLTSFLG